MSEAVLPQARKISFIKRHFNFNSLKTKGLTLLIEHAPCCILSFAAGFVGLPFLNHNPVLELGFALGGAVVGENIGHRLFHKHGPDKAGHAGCGAASGHRWGSVARRYALSLAFGLASWGVHQALFHDHSHLHDHGAHYEQHQAHGCDTHAPHEGHGHVMPLEPGQPHPFAIRAAQPPAP